MNIKELTYEIAMALEETTLIASGHRDLDIEYPYISWFQWIQGFGKSGLVTDKIHFQNFFKKMDQKWD